MLKDKLFQRIGELTVQFATLEHRLQQLLELLMGKDNILIGPLFIHNLSLAALLRKIRIVTQYKVRENTRLLYDLERTVKAIDTVREERNLLTTESGRSKTPTLFRSKSGTSGCAMRAGTGRNSLETSLTEKKVTHLVRRLKGLAHDVEHLIHELGSSKMAPQTATDAS